MGKGERNKTKREKETIVFKNSHLTMFTPDTDQAIKNLELGSVRDSYMLSSVMAEVRDKMALFTEARSKLAAKYAEKGPDGKPAIDQATQVVKITDVPKFTKEMEELFEIEVKLNTSKIKIDLDKLGSNKCPVKVTDFLLPFLKVE